MEEKERKKMKEFEEIEDEGIKINIVEDNGDKINRIRKVEDKNRKIDRREKFEVLDNIGIGEEEKEIERCDIKMEEEEGKGINEINYRGDDILRSIVE